MKFGNLVRRYQKFMGSKWDEDQHDFIEDVKLYFKKINSKRIDELAANDFEMVFKKNIQSEVLAFRGYHDYDQYLTFLPPLFKFYSSNFNQSFEIPGLVNIKQKLLEYCYVNRYCAYKNLHRLAKRIRSKEEANNIKMEKIKLRNEEIKKHKLIKIEKKKRLDERRRRHHMISAYLGKKATLKEPMDGEDV